MHLLGANATKQLSGNGGGRVFVRDVDALWVEVTARGAICKPAQNYDYGMREFDVDLDGTSLFRRN